MKDSTKGAILFCFAITSGIGDLFAFFHGLPAYVTYSALAAFSGFVSFAIYYFVQQAKRNKLIASSVQGVERVPNPALYTDSFIISYNSTLLDLEDFDGKLATITQRTTVRCVKAGANRYHYRFVPTKGYSNFKFSPGVVLTNDEEGGGVDVITEFSRPCTLGEVKELELSTKLTDLFLDENEHWCVNRHYTSNGSYILNLRFPKNRSPKKWSIYRILDGNFKNQQSFEGEIKEQIEDNRTLLVIDASSLAVMETVLVKWTW